MSSFGVGAAVRRLGRYHLAEPQGGGPTGEVFRAKVYGVAGFERQFAVKRFHAEFVKDPDTAAAVAGAARIYGSLEHPRIARLQEYGVAGGQTFTAVEWVSGVDLGRLLSVTTTQSSSLKAGAAAALVSQISRAVGYAHGRGVCHLGLCPTNLICTRDGTVKVTDFGFLPPRLPSRPADDHSLRARIPYMAPEQLVGEQTSSATDVFQLGVIVYELFTGRRCFAGATPLDVAQQILSARTQPPSLPKPIVSVLMRCLARSPFERYPDAGAFADALDAAVRSSPLPGTAADAGVVVRDAIQQIDRQTEGDVSGALSFPMPAPPAGRPQPSKMAALLQEGTAKPPVTTQLGLAPPGTARAPQSGRISTEEPTVIRSAESGYMPSPAKPPPIPTPEHLERLETVSDTVVQDDPAATIQTPTFAAPGARDSTQRLSASDILAEEESLSSDGVELVTLPDPVVPRPFVADVLGHAPVNGESVTSDPLVNSALPPPVAGVSPNKRMRRGGKVLGAMAILLLASVGGFLGYQHFSGDTNRSPGDAVAKSSHTGNVPAEARSSDAAPAEVVDAGTPTSDAAVAVTVDAPSGKPDASSAEHTPTKLVIRSKPKRALVYLDGSLQGKTPITLDATADSHRLALVKPGYQLHTATISGASTNNVTLVPATPLEGPAGIKVRCRKKRRYYVFVDGHHTGQLCPTERIGVRLGDHTVDIYDPVTDSRRSFPTRVRETRISKRVRVD